MPCSRRPGRFPRDPRRGQVLLVAVLLMGAILLLGALFVAIVQYNQFQSSRHGNVIVARNLAEAGIRYADYQLQISAAGADWRPPKPPMQDVGAGIYDTGFWGTDAAPGTDDDYYLPEEMVRGFFGQYDSTSATLLRLGYTRYPDATTGTADLSTVGDRGHVFLRVSYDPGPPFEPKDGAPVTQNTSKYIKIEAVGVVMALSPVLRRLVAYKPIGLTDYLFWVTDKDGAARPAYFGCQPGIDFDGSGTVSVSTTAGLPVGQRGEFLVCPFEGPIRVNTELRFVGDNAGLWLSPSAPVPAQASNQLLLYTTSLPPDALTGRLTTNGYLRDDALEVRKGISDLQPGGAWAQSAAVTFTAWSSGSAVITGPSWIRQSTDPLYSTNSGTVLDGNDRQLDPGGSSRMVKKLSAPDAFTPDPATGVDRYRAASRDVGPLVTTDGRTVHLGELGHRDGSMGGGMYVDNSDDIQFARANGTHDLQTLVEDWLRQIPEGDPRGSQSGWNAVYTVYAPPGVEVQLFDTELHTMASAGPSPTIVTDPTAAPGGPGSMWWPYHLVGQPGIKLTRHDRTWYTSTGAESGVNTIYIDYPQYPYSVIFAEGNIRIKGVLPPASRTGPPALLLLRDYNLTVVSGGTIYIDGQILSPQDVSFSVSDENNTHIALLAHDHVCLNPTMLVPQLTSGMVPAGPDDPANPDPDRLHWALSGGGTGTVSASFFFGSPPAGGDQVRLHVTHTAADPGPSGAGMSIQIAGSAPVDYDFGGGALTYALMPPGAPIPGGVGANIIAPLWETTLAWTVNTYISTAAGIYNTISLFQSDPGMAPGSTDYWVRRFKLQEWHDYGAGAPDWQPVRSLRARVNALVYAQEGTWFVIPGSYFDPAAVGLAQATAFRRYNYAITFHGAITESYTASPDAVRDWMDKWSYPWWSTGAGGALDLCWGSLVYEFDESLRAGRDQPPTALSGNIRVSSANPHFVGADPSFLCLWNLPRLPLLPVSPDLIYFGEAF